ncbi:MAG: rod shape-determining protein MreC [Candidatus Portnoybacteria bacterium]|nr:rod shape-determining protein MreC [Candidatus Portnoybacteria bacterium]
MFRGTKNHSRFLSAAITAVILLLIFFASQGWLSFLKDGAWLAMKPLTKSFFWVEQKTFGTIKVFITLKDLIEENNFLRQENADLWQKVSELKEAVRENELLRQRLQIEKNSVQPAVMAEVIGTSPQSGQYLLINKGLIDGLVEGAWAVSADNFLVGHLGSVESKTAKVLLLSSSETVLSAVAQDSRASGIIKGAHGLGLSLEMIPMDQDPQVGETVLALGRVQSRGADLIVGQIKEIIKKENELFKSARIEPAVDWSALEEIFILK